MINDFQHLLTKHGVLVAFNISKRISKSYLTNLKNKLNFTTPSKPLLLRISHEPVPIFENFDF